MESNESSLTKGINARKSDFIRSKSIRVKVGTWNTAAFKNTVEDIGSWFFEGKGFAREFSGLHLDDHNHAYDDHAARSQRADDHDSTFEPNGQEIDLYLLGLQEIVDIGSATEAFRPFTDPEPALRWKSAIQSGLPKDYTLIAEQQLTGLLLLIYASPDIAKDITSVSTTSTGTGLMGYLGNKGAVAARIVLGEGTKLVFVNSHLASGSDKASLERRNWDYAQIVNRIRFDIIPDAEDMFGSSSDGIDEADFAFWVGDLNYRLTEMSGEDVRHLLSHHIKDIQDFKRPSRDDFSPDDGSRSARSFGKPSNNNIIDSPYTDDDDDDNADDSFQMTINSLLLHDELHQQMKARVSFHNGWQEGPITFLPTYKYDPGTVSTFDTSDKKRAPSWCDRILYRTKKHKLDHEKRLLEEAESRKKDEEMVKNGVVESTKDEELLYDYDPDEDGDNNLVEERPELKITTNQDENDYGIHLEHYAAHQKISSSDHKPVDAIAILKYDHVVPQLRAQVHQEIARSLDKAENDTRPNITIIIDKHYNDDSSDPTYDGVDFGTVRYAIPKYRSLTLANTGQVKASISCINDARRWLEIYLDPVPVSVMSKSLEPGETCHVELHLKVVDVSLVKELNDELQQLDNNLVLRVDKGRDHFIPIRGRWAETCLGRSIDKLLHPSQSGVRKLRHQSSIDNFHEKGRNGSKTRQNQSRSGSRHRDISNNRRNKRGRSGSFSAPRELFRLTEAAEKLLESAIAEWEMIADNKQAPWILSPGWPFLESSYTFSDHLQREELSGIFCEALDLSLALETCIPPNTSKLATFEAFACFLLQFLTLMSEGVVTNNLWLKIVEKQEERIDQTVEDVRASMQEIMSESPAHSISFILLTSMIDKVIGEECSSTLRSHPSDTAPFQVVSTLSRMGSLRRKSRTTESEKVFRQDATKAMAEIFGKAIVRIDGLDDMKNRIELQERRTKLVQLFLSSQDLCI